jgi:hypothetical protein
MDVKWKMENMIPCFLRGVLRHQGEALPTLGMANYEWADMRTSEGTVAIRSQLQAREIVGLH